jgi:hypothetical protein
MITQKLKHWLSHLFAWWPWNSPSPDTYFQSSNTAKSNTPQETSWRSTLDGPQSHPGIISIIIDDFIVEADSFEDEEATDHDLTTPPHSRITWNEEIDSPWDDTQQDLVVGKAEQLLPGRLQDQNTQPQDAAQNEPTFSPMEQRRLAFLHYMHQQGILNEHGPTTTAPNEDQ